MSMFRSRKDASSSAETKTPAAPGGDVPIWPSGIARYRDGILEVTTDGTRVAVGDITEISIKPPRAGRLSLELKHRGGLNSVGRGFWVERHHEAALADLVQRVGRDTHP